jgi:hypothetical protein
MGGMELQGFVPRHLGWAVGMEAVDLAVPVLQADGLVLGDLAVIAYQVEV